MDVCKEAISYKDRFRVHGHLRPQTKWPKVAYLKGSEWTEDGRIRLPFGVVMDCCVRYVVCAFSRCRQETSNRVLFQLYRGGPVFCVISACKAHQDQVSPPAGAAKAFIATLPADTRQMHVRKWQQACRRRLSKPAVMAPPKQKARVSPDLMDAMARLLDE